jgi:histidinol-phosphate aminotransferase
VDPLRFIRSDFEQLEEYVPVKPLDVLAAEIGMPVDQLVKLDANENLYGPAQEIRDAIASADLHIYPDPGQTALRQALGEYCSVGPEQVVAGSGADDLIDILIRLVDPEAVVISPPSFGMYGFLAKINRTRVVSVPRMPDFALDVPSIARAVQDSNARLVFLASPNNPTGNLVSEAETEALCELEALVVIDEAYIEFSGGSVVSLIARFPNLVVLRTFSKWAGLAGLRVGYGIANPEIARRMMAIKQPYNVNVAGDVAAQTALRLRHTVNEGVRALVAERERMVAEVTALGWLKPIPSAANFVLFAVEGRSGKDVRDSLRSRGVLVRYYDSPELQNYIRISAGRPEDTDRLLAALRSL